MAAVSLVQRHLIAAKLDDAVVVAKVINPPPHPPMAPLTPKDALRHMTVEERRGREGLQLFGLMAAALSGAEKQRDILRIGGNLFGSYENWPEDIVRMW
jgi:hypothetical protein